MTTTSRRWLLRERTAGAHAAVDAAVGGFRDLNGYRHYLGALSRFRVPIERQLAELSWPAGLAGWRPNAVADAVAADLADLGIEPPQLAPSPLQLTGDHLFGTLYVLEGSSLGAQILLARARDLGLSDDFGARHLALLSGGVAHWRGFLELLEAAEPFDVDMAVSASVATFALAHAAFEAR